MKIRRVKSKGLVVSGLPAGHLRLLRQIPAHADPAGSAAAHERLYQEPVRQPEDGADDELNTDWREHVVPDLTREFNRQLDVVNGDLAQARRAAGGEAEGESYEFFIPWDHVEPWYGALNQARLVMQARYRFPEIDSTEALMELLQSENLKPYLTSRFYVEMQSALLDLGMQG